MKKTRVVVSLIFFLLITFLFIDFTNALTGSIISAALYLQFIPSLLDFLMLASISAAGFVFILLITLLFGRLYCSSVCPLGTLQDIFIWLKKRSRYRKIFRKKRPFTILRYSILGLGAVFLVAGLITPVLFLDPYSNFGRIIANIFRPLYLLLNNFGALVLESMDVYTLYRVEPGVTHWFSVAFSIGLFLFLLWFSLRHARLFCNTLCPVGALLGLFSRFSLFRISLDHSVCTSCGKCSAVCKAGCIDVKTRKVDFSRCVGCLNCLDSCPDNGVIFSRKRGPGIPVVKPFDPVRRNLLAGAVLTTATLASTPSFAGGRKGGGGQCKSPQAVNRKYPVTPPGSLSLERFNDACTACHLCVSACPTHVIKPAFLEYGLTGMMQPRMDYYANYCNFDCIACTEVCPTGALRPVPVEEKHTLQLGKVKFVKHNCIVYTKGTDCGACSEHCPTKAVKMRPYMNKLFLPIVESNICVGCGACEYACPTEPKSIYVEGNPIHLVADKPLVRELEQPDTQEDFPF
ncbi:MAG TPA: 4Fe-4S binding protein [Bacteroidales bacterium]|nr:4Fe-4S binding protein [Bacteroidales bacterium]